jgi:hypothetical protein
MKEILEKWKEFLIKASGLDEWHPEGSYKDVKIYVKDENGKFIHFDFIVKNGTYEYKFPLFELASVLKTEALKYGRNGFKISSWKEDEETWKSSVIGTDLIYSGRCEAEVIFKAFKWVYNYDK